MRSSIALPESSGNRGHFTPAAPRLMFQLKQRIGALIGSLLLHHGGVQPGLWNRGGHLFRRRPDVGAPVKIAMGL